jgi:hypothetical protein
MCLYKLVRTLLCSATSHDSNAEFKSDVAMPLKRRPASSTLKSLKCLVTQPLVYMTTYASAAFFLPLMQYTERILSCIPQKPLLSSKCSCKDPVTMLVKMHHDQQKGKLSTRKTRHWKGVPKLDGTVFKGGSEGIM